MSGVFKKLYRRTIVTWSQEAEKSVGNGIQYSWSFTTPGYFSFDFMCNVPTPGSGNLPQKYFIVKVNGVERFKVRASWAWQRTFIYVDQGPITVEFIPLDYETDDYAKIRRIVHREFVPCTEFEQIESTTMPKPLEQVTSFQVLQGWQRYQRTGSRGTELEFTLVFKGVENWRNFMKKLATEGNYVIQGDYGTYGGVILPQDVDSARSGDLILTKCKMNSPLTAGVGVDGI